MGAAPLRRRWAAHFLLQQVRCADVNLAERPRCWPGCSKADRPKFRPHIKNLPAAPPARNVGAEQFLSDAGFMTEGRCSAARRNPGHAVGPGTATRIRRTKLTSTGRSNEMRRLGRTRFRKIPTTGGCVFVRPHRDRPPPHKNVQRAAGRTQSRQPAPPVSAGRLFFF